ncbi:MAG: hypothetical protein JNJ56_03900 [Ignavibacteria bacterium]|nr:hypothetical protein [Ignavibacteria bacterium]
MKTFKYTYFILTVYIICSVSACSYNNLQPSEFDIESAGSNFVIETASKCHAIDGSVIVYKSGFSVINNTIMGEGERFFFNGKENNSFINRFMISSFPLDSIVAITLYEDYTGTRLIANGSLGAFGFAIGGITIYCIACPKCCFGSCPTVYTSENNISLLETELFSSSISRMLEDNDLDKLNQKVPDDGIYKLKITNEALETHYIDKFNLIAAEHPSGTKVYPNISKGLTIINRTVPVETAVNSEGEDILKEVAYEDTISYRSGMTMVNKLKNGPAYDRIEFTSAIPENGSNAKLLVRYRNTLLSTILFYDVVLGSQGIRAVEWIDKMNNNETYAADFKMIYDNFSGMQFEIFVNGEWVEAEKFPDAGPICWKQTAAEIPVSGMKELKCRIKFIPDNFMIDYIGIEYGGYDECSLKTDTVRLSEIKSLSGKSTDNAFGLIQNSDKQYLITNPGDSYTLIYKIKKTAESEQTLFISSRGYYNEWIRGSWIKNDPSAHIFNLYNINGNLRLVAESWESNKTLIESEFFNTRIPVKEK